MPLPVLISVPVPVIPVRIVVCAVLLGVSLCIVDYDRSLEQVK